MVVVQCIKWDTEHSSLIPGGWWLRYELEKLLSKPLNVWITELFHSVCQNVGKPENSLDNVTIRIARNKEPKAGHAFKAPFQNRDKNLRPDSLPDMIIGYSGDLVEFGKTLIHEALHLLNYDEEMVEAKAQEIWRYAKMR